MQRHLCNVSEDASPVENRNGDQNPVLIRVFARELHDDVPLDKLGAGCTNRPTHTVGRLMGKCRR